MSLKLRLLLSTTLLVVIGIVISTTLAVNIAVSKANQSLTQAAQEKLVSNNSQVSEVVDEYFGFIESQIRSVSRASSTLQASQSFTSSFARYLDQRGTNSEQQNLAVEQFYSNQFGRRFAEVNPKPLSNPSGLLSGLSKTALALQHDFIASSDFPLGEKDKLVSLSNNSDYAQAHKQYHGEFQQFLTEFGYYDIFIVDANSGDIVYSVYKELDFATNLRSGPYAKTGIGEVFKQASNANNANQVFFSTIASYLPSYDSFAGFAASPIYNNGSQVGVLIFQMPMDHVNGILTHNQNWKKTGFGASGETYLVNPNGLLLTESRFFVEDKSGYIDAIRGKYPAAAKQVSVRDTSVGIQPVESTSAKQALAGKTGFDVVRDYRGVEVFSAYAPIKLGNQNLALLAEIDVEEALAPSKELRNSLIQSAIVAALVLAVAATIIALWIGNRLVKPLDEMGDACEELSHGEGDLTVQLKESGIPEFDRIARPFNHFIAQIRSIVLQVKTDAEMLSASSQELSTITAQSEASATQQRDQTSMVASAMEQLSMSIAEVSRSSQDTSDKSMAAQASLKENMERADMAAENIRLLVQLITDSSEVISSLKDEVNQITTVLGVITSIADQTNLLALNAAIEAARAGEAGRGFSVVADEVRALATRSQESTVEISKMVEVMNQSSSTSVDRMERAARAADGGIHLVDLVTVAMNELEENLKVVLNMTDVIASAAQEQDVTSDAVVENVHNINNMSKDVQEGAAQTSSAAEELARIAANTQSLVSRFKV